MEGSVKRLNTEVLVLVEGDLGAQRLIVTWASVGEMFDAAGEDEVKREAALQRWSRISGVDIEDIERLEPLLFENGILAAGGMADPTALGFIRKRVIESLGKAQKAK